MKKIISLLLAFVMLFSVSAAVSADSPTYSKNFSSKDEMLSSLSEYSNSFPDVEDYYSSDLSEKREGLHLERREIFLPYFGYSAYTATAYSYGESRWGKGVDYVFAAFCRGEETVRVIVYHGVTEEQINEKLEHFTAKPESSFFSDNGEITGKVFAASETPQDDGTKTCEYLIKNRYSGDILTCIYTNSDFDESLVSSLRYEKAGFLLPIYVEDYEGYNDKIQYDGMFFEKLFYACGYDIGDLIREYKELYYHYDENNNLDWVLIRTSNYMVEPWNVKPYAVLGNRVIRCGATYMPFVAEYGIYDVAEDKFISITRVGDTDSYEGLEEAFDLVNAGEIIGDVDKDSQLTVKDATFIQKCVACLCDFASDDAVEGTYTSYYGELAYVSDFNRDGERNVKDATAIQKYIAGLEY